MKQQLLGALGIVANVGLLLVAVGVLPLGVRGVATLALAGNVWLFGVVVALGVHFHER